MLKPNLWTVAALVVLAACSRLLPHWWNLTAVGAVCLFGGAYFQRWWVAFLVPLAGLAISDWVLQTYIYPGYPADYLKYVWFALSVPLGLLLRDHKRLLPVASAAVGSAALFFLLSNFQVWAGGHGEMYPKTPAGLLACYVAAIPFAWNTLYGNLLFSAVLFGGMEMRQAWSARLAAAPATSTAVAR